MGRKYASIDIEKRLKQGYGRGRGKDYRPWLAVQSFSSRGYASRAPGWKTGREHHLMSNLELDFFHVLDLSPCVVDVREQYPLLPVEETIAIARVLGVRHPIDRRTKNPIALTTDFLINRHGQPREIEKARTTKPSNELGSERQLEKFEIERHYWRARNIDWAIITELNIPRSLARNLTWLHPYFKLPETLKLVDGYRQKVDHLLRDALGRGTGLAAAPQACDDKLGLEAGTSLTVARHLIASRRWKVELNVVIDPAFPLKILNGAA